MSDLARKGSDLEGEYDPGRRDTQASLAAAEEGSPKDDSEAVSDKLDRVSEELRVSTFREELLMAAVRKIERDCEEAKAATAELVQYQAMLEDARSRIAVLESALDDVLQRLNARTSTDAAVRASVPAPGLVQSAQARRVDLASLRPASDEEKVLHREAATPTEPAGAATPGQPRRVPGTLGEIFVFDAGSVADDISAQLSAWGHHAVGLDPDPSLGINLAGRTVGAAAVNLAIPSSWGAVRRLCGQRGSTEGPLIAYAQNPESVRAFWLGPVQFAILPLDDSDVAAIFRRGAPDARSVLAVSSDIDLMRQVRRELERIKVSASVALDYRQALDMIPIVRPDAALVHLSPHSDAPFRVLAQLRNIKVPKPVPLVLVLDTEARPKDASFFSAEMGRLAARGPMSSTDLIKSCARAIAQLAAPPPGSPAG